MRVLLSLLLTLIMLVNQIPAFGYYVPIKKFGHNNFGTAIDGSKTVTTNPETITHTGTTPLVLQYDDLTINSSCWLQIRSAAGCIIYVKDDCVINGALTVSTNGSKAAPTEGIHHRQFVDSSGVKGLTTTYHTPAAGGTGGATQSTGIGTAGNAGGTATNSSGGGGSGAGGAGGGSNTGSGGAGGDGTCWGGGSGGGSGGFSGTGTNGTAGAANCGAGGNAGAAAGINRGYGGGAGNSGGTGTQSGTGTGNNGLDTTGGHLWLIVGDDLTIGAAGVINTPGQAGGNANATGTSAALGGGGSGGGITEVYYGGTLSNSGTITAGGGSGGVGTAVNLQANGGAGGAGTVRGPTKISQVNPGGVFLWVAYRRRKKKAKLPEVA